MRIAFGLVVVGALPIVAAAQSNITPANRHSWSENAGWLTWRFGSTQGARMMPRFLAGFIWSENLGWINLGNGIVGPCGQYPAAASQSGSAFGVNLERDAGDPQGRRVLLTGYAWGENCGWINFGGGALASPPLPAYIDTGGPGLLSGRLRGFAWSENEGWINLDVVTAGQHAAFCYANCDGSGGSPALTANDFQCFINRYANQDADANCDGSTGTPCLTANDFQCFLNAFAAGCS